jgi:predicted Zn-dependent peptidase
LGTFPYGRPENGTDASIQKIDFADLLEAKQRFFTADNATVVLSGKFDQNLAFRAVRRYLGAWLKADKLVPSTFRRPDDPSTALLTVDSPVPERFDVRFITRGTSRGSADVTAYFIVARIVEARLKNLAPGHANDIVVNSYPHVLPGTFVIAFSGTKDASTQKLEASDLISKALNATITETEFQAAKQAFLADQEKTPVADRWLDIDTFKVDRPAKEQAEAAATTIANAQDVLARIQKQPIASVVVSSDKARN